MEFSSPHPPFEDRSSDPFKSNSTLLRFPIPEADEKVSAWLHQSGTAAMSSSVEDFNTLGDSAYEFVDTDEESRDGNATESIASTDVGRPDDVASLADTEQSDAEQSDSERSRATSGIPAFSGLDAPRQTPILEQSTAGFADEVDRTLAQSIEFEEPVNLGDETVSVKHTVADFSEEQTAAIVARMRLGSQPKRIVATIRQTMTREGLSTRDPLRILYVGCHTAKQDIIRKIASSVAASVGNTSSSYGHRSSQIFHVVPITAFGSEKPPEIELMQSSGYQIKVEDCTAAKNLKCAVGARADLIKLRIDDAYTYSSVPDPASHEFLLQPAWELPHVAIFYCSENDNIEMRRIRLLAKTFMSRHKVPSIVISHRQLFDNPFEEITLDQHAIHMCLESRDPNRRNVIHQRLPIDLDSFKTIDARQMNRNLAYLTGLHESPETLPQNIDIGKIIPRTLASDIEKTSYSLSDSINFIRTRKGAEWRALVPVGILLLSVFAAVLTVTLQYRSASTHSVSINGNPTSTEPMSENSTPATLVITVVTPSLMTSTETRTATRTITVIRSENSASNSLSLKQSMELGNVAENSQPMPPQPEEKSYVCKAEVLGDREILIRIPTTTKWSWLSNEAMSVNITRERENVETERVYSTGGGIVLQLAEKDAYGVLNISVVTKRKPKINETFTIDFGTNQRQAEFSWERLRENFQFAESIIENTMSQLRILAENAASQSQFLSGITRERFEEARRTAEKHAADSCEQVTKLAKDVSLDIARWTAILTKEIGMQVAEARNRLNKVCCDLQDLPGQTVPEPIQEAILIAQVRSRLYWLKIQGRHEEHHDYKLRATRAFQRRAEEGAKVKRTREEISRKEKRAEWAAARRERKACRKGGKTGCGS